MSTKDKEKIIGEELSAEKIARFLDMQPYEDTHADFHMLEKAYRGLPAEALGEFLDMFVAKGHDINATNKHGQTLLSIVQQHSNQPGYVDVLTRHGAQ